MCSVDLGAVLSVHGALVVGVFFGCMYFLGVFMALLSLNWERGAVWVCSVDTGAVLCLISFWVYL